MDMEGQTQSSDLVRGLARDLGVSLCKLFPYVINAMESRTNKTVEQRESERESFPVLRMSLIHPYKGNLHFKSSGTHIRHLRPASRRHGERNFPY